MVSEEKVRLMIKVNKEETKDYKKELKFVNYSRFGYVGMHVLANIIYLSLAYFLIAILITIYSADYLFTEDFINHYMYYLRGMLIPYLIVMIVAGILCGIHYFGKYNKNKSKIREYRKSVDALADYYKREKGESK
ncbi:MAG: hypothetical protein K6G11_07325 [Lachnospiraceae bacterium]|nr:hypothetical protein [Lachnospiraceae bacterium]